MVLFELQRDRPELAEIPGNATEQPEAQRIAETSRGEGQQMAVVVGKREV